MKNLTKNYTDAQCATIKAAAPLNLDKAKLIANAMGKKYRSVIAKAISMGVPYDAAKPMRKDGTPVARKSALVIDIAKHLDTPADDLFGLVKAPRSVLVSLLSKVS